MNLKQKIVHNDRRTQQKGSRYGHWLKYAKPVFVAPIFLLPLISLWLRSDPGPHHWLNLTLLLMLAILLTNLLAIKTALSEENRKELGRMTIPVLGRTLFFMISKRSRDHLIGDLEEEYRTHVLTVHGRFYAWCWWWWQVMRIVGPYVWKQLGRALGLEILRGWRRP